MKLNDRLAKLEESRNGTPAQVWLFDLLAEIEAAKLEGREPAPRQPTVKENTEVILLLKRHGINAVIDTGESEW